MNKTIVFDKKTSKKRVEVQNYTLELDMTVTKGKELKDEVITKEEFYK